MKFFKSIQEDFKKILLFYVLLEFTLILILTIFSVPAFEDFYSYYTIDGMHVARGDFPFRDFTPFYPIIMEYFLGLFGLTSMNVLFARIIQAIINIGILFVIYDICKITSIKNSKKLVFFYIFNIIILFFSVIQVNNDILLVLFVVLSLDFYLRKNYPLVGIFVALGFLTKLFAVIIIIPIGIFLLKKKEIKNVILLIIGFLIAFLSLIIPFWMVSGSSIFDIVLNPFKMTLGHPLNQPYYLIHGFGVPKELLQTISSITAICIILFYLFYLKRDEEELTLKTIFYSLSIFMLFQSFLVPWYFVWIMPIYHLIQKDNIDKKIWFVQILIFVNFLLYSAPGYLIYSGIIPNINTMENFYITTSIFGSILFGLGVLLLQFSILLLLTDENQNVPDKKLVITNCAIEGLTLIFLILTVYSF
ncbi:MAG: glycosyltransferase family 39 protein [Candidatus Helarchaeota archaeon]